MSGAAVGQSFRSFLALEHKPFLRFARAESIEFWLLIFYIFIEYIRPQSRYSALDFFPWGQASILGCLALYLVKGRRVALDNPADWLMAAFTAVILASSLNAYYPSVSIEGWALWANWLIAYFLITRIVDTDRRFFAFLVGWMLWNLNMAQYAARSWALNGFRFRSWGVTGSPGWFRNSGEFGIEMTLFLPICICFALAVRQYVSGWKKAALYSIPAMVMLGVVGSSSRGALIGTGAVAIWLMLKSPRRITTLVVLGIAALSVVTIIPDQSKARFAEMGDDPDSVRRLMYWSAGIQIMRDHPALGIGYDNWLPYYGRTHFVSHAAERPDLFRRAEPQLSHNPFIQAGSELGFTGLGVYVLLILTTLIVNMRTRRLSARHPDPDIRRFRRLLAHGLDGALIGYLTSGFFVTVLFYPFFWMNLAMSVALYRISAKAPGQKLRPSNRRSHVRTSNLVRP